MQRFITTAVVAAMPSGATMAPTSARAEYNFGPMKTGTQCYKMAANGWNNQGFGFWNSCPAPAAAPAATSGPSAPPATQPSRTVDDQTRMNKARPCVAPHPGWMALPFATCGPELSPAALVTAWTLRQYVRGNLAIPPSCQ
jgi:hypothetical protein